MIYYVYWDCSCQCELFRGTLEECEHADRETIFGGGSYTIYPCLKGYKIVSVRGRTDGSPLQIVLEEEA